jgi:hypothetical protein
MRRRSDLLAAIAEEIDDSLGARGRESPAAPPAPRPGDDPESGAAVPAGGVREAARLVPSRLRRVKIAGVVLVAALCTFMLFAVISDAQVFHVSGPMMVGLVGASIVGAWAGAVRFIR